MKCNLFDQLNEGFTVLNSEHEDLTRTFYGMGRELTIIWEQILSLRDYFYSSELYSPDTYPLTPKPQVEQLRLPSRS
jgi:hypothetical protein